MPRSAETIQLVGDSQQWMVNEHARSRVAHDFLYAGALRRLVAVHGTVGTGRLVIAVGAFVEAHIGVFQELPAVRAQLVPWTIVVRGAVDADHPGHGQPLSGEMFLF